MRSLPLNARNSSIGTAVRIVLVAALFVAGTLIQIVFYPASYSTLLTVLQILPVALAAASWGWIAGMAAGLIATASIDLLMVRFSPSLLPTVSILGAIFFVGVGVLVGRMSDLVRANRRRAARLAAAEDHLSSILAAAKDGIITIDPDGRVTSWNFAAEQLFGWSAAEALGQDLHKFIAKPRHGESADRGIPVFPRPDEQRIIRTTLEREGIRRDGSTFPAELSLASFLVAGRRHAVGIVRDIADRRAIEVRYRRLFETVPVGLFHVDLDGTILDANPALVEMLGFPDRESLLAVNAASLFVEPGTDDAIRKGLEDKSAVHVEIKFRCRDGRSVDCLLSATAHRAPDGRVIGYEGSLKDVTELITKYALQHRSMHLAAIEALASGVAHDFGNILAGIRGFAEHLGHSTDHAIARIGRRIADAVDRADRITTDLLSVMGSVALHAQRVNLNEIGRAAIRSLEPRHHPAVELVCAEEPVEVVVDPEAIVSVILELIENAVRASPAATPVVVVIRVAPSVDAKVAGFASDWPGPWACVSVIDHGTGMDEVTRARIFEPYFSTRPFGTGSGLGLVRVLGTLRQYGGGISVDSAPGRGTTMTISLPLSAAGNG